MPSTEILALLVYASAMAFSPGPNTTLSAALGASGGVCNALPFVVSVPVGWSCILVLWSLGLGAVAAWAEVRPALQVGAGVYMLYLAYALSQRSVLVGAKAGAGGLGSVGFWKGVALQFVNGKAWLNAATISATWVAVNGETAERLATVLPLMACFGLSSNLLYAVVGSALRQWLAHGQRLRNFNRTLAVFLAATALWVLAQGLQLR